MCNASSHWSSPHPWFYDINNSQCLQNYKAFHDINIHREIINFVIRISLINSRDYFIPHLITSEMIEWYNSNISNSPLRPHVDGSVQESRLVMELRLPWTNPLIYRIFLDLVVTCTSHFSNSRFKVLWLTINLRIKHNQQWQHQLKRQSI